MKSASIGVAAIAAAAFATPVLAQEVIEDPGYCAQLDPDGNCQNREPGNPLTDAGHHRDWRNSNAVMSHQVPELSYYGGLKYND